MSSEAVAAQRAREEEFRQATTWLLAAAAGLGLIGGVWKLVHDTAGAVPTVRPKRPWDLT